MKLLLFTDIHLTTPGTTIAGRDPNTHFARALQHAVSRHSDARALIITGDLSDWGERDDYVRLRRYLAAVPFPSHLAIGNHDDRATFLEVFPEATDENGFVQSVVDLGDATGLILDTWDHPETHAGAFCATRRAWLEAQLARATKPVWLFMHHNPVPTHVGPLDQIMLQEAPAFGALVRAHRQRILHIVFGHCHLPITGSLHGVPVSSARGTNHAGFARFDEPELLVGADLPPAYSVAIADGAAVTIHMIEFMADATVRAAGSPDRRQWDRQSTQR